MQFDEDENAMIQVEKRYFKGTHVTLNSNSASSPSKNDTWVSSEKRCFKDSNGILN